MINIFSKTSLTLQLYPLTLQLYPLTLQLYPLTLQLYLLLRIPIILPKRSIIVKYIYIGINANLRRTTTAIKEAFYSVLLEFCLHSISWCHLLSRAVQDMRLGLNATSLATVTVRCFTCGCSLKVKVILKLISSLRENIIVFL